VGEGEAAPRKTKDNNGEAGGGRNNRIHCIFKGGGGGGVGGGRILTSKGDQSGFPQGHWGLRQRESKLSRKRWSIKRLAKRGLGQGELNWNVDPMGLRGGKSLSMTGL